MRPEEREIRIRKLEVQQRGELCHRVHLEIFLYVDSFVSSPRATLQLSCKLLISRTQKTNALCKSGSDSACLTNEAFLHKSKLERIFPNWGEKKNPYFFFLHFFSFFGEVQSRLWYKPLSCFLKSNPSVFYWRGGRGGWGWRWKREQLFLPPAFALPSVWRRQELRCSSPLT